MTAWLEPNQSLEPTRVGSASTLDRSMNLISKLLGRNKGGAGADPQRPALGAREAIELARQGRIPVQEMLGVLVASNLFIPLVEPPSMDAEIIKSWKPATVSKEVESRVAMQYPSTSFISSTTKQCAGEK